MPPGPQRPPRTDQGPPDQSIPPARSPDPRRDRGNRPGPTATPAAASQTQTTARPADGTGALPAPGLASDRPDHMQSMVRLNNQAERDARPAKTQQKISVGSARRPPPGTGTPSAATHPPSASMDTTSSPPSATPSRGTPGCRPSRPAPELRQKPVTQSESGITLLTCGPGDLNVYERP
jgi:hypothetical protein